jgi:Membrane-associating domain
LIAIISICSFDNQVTFQVMCKAPEPQVPKPITFAYDYPYKLDHLPRQLACSQPEDKYLSLFGDFSSDAEFFCAVGVLSLMAALASCAGYLLYEMQYQNNPLIPLADFGITALFALLWLSASAAWANGLSGLKHSTDPNILMGTAQCAKEMCTSVFTGGFSGLNTSVVWFILYIFSHKKIQIFAL